MNLNLDHFYCSFPPKVFEELIPLIEVFPRSNHKKIEREDTSYEGIYIHTRQGQYIEILKNEQRFTIVALQSFESPNIDINKLKNPFPEKLEWDESDVVKSPSAKEWSGPEEWFKPLMLKIVKPFKWPEEAGFVGTWIINYQNEEYNRVINVNKGNIHEKDKDEPDFEIEQVITAKIGIPEYYYRILPELFSWFAKEIREMDEEIVVVVNNPNGKDIEFTYVTHPTHVGFLSIELELVNKEKYEHLKPIGCVSFTKNDSNLILYFEPLKQ